MARLMKPGGVWPIIFGMVLIPGGIHFRAIDSRSYFQPASDADLQPTSGNQARIQQIAVARPLLGGVLLPQSPISQPPSKPHRMI